MNIYKIIAHKTRKNQPNKRQFLLPQPKIHLAFYSFHLDLRENTINRRPTLVPGIRNVSRKTISMPIPHFHCYFYSGSKTNSNGNKSKCKNIEITKRKWQRETEIL